MSAFLGDTRLLQREHADVAMTSTCTVKDIMAEMRESCDLRRREARTGVSARAMHCHLPTHGGVLFRVTDWWRRVQPLMPLVFVFDSDRA